MRLLTSIAGLVLALAPAIPAWPQSAAMKQAQGLFKPIPATPPGLPGNPATPEKVALGKMLYFDPRLSESHVISCNSCHMIGMGGMDLQETSFGHRWQRGGRNSPTVYNAVFDIAQFWDGRASDLEQQAGGPLVNPVEMDTTEAHVVEQLKGIPGYGPLFASAFPGEDPLTFANIRRALAVFEATLITPDAPFDRYLRGDGKALDPAQADGLAQFIGKGCAACHNGINLGGGQYAPFGVVERPGADILPPGDKGRFEVTRTVSDEYVFRVPSLRNVALTPPYFHSGKVWDLRQAVAIMGNSQLGAKLTDREVDAITAFLGSLTGRQPEVTLPSLPPSVATTPPTAPVAVPKNGARDNLRGARCRKRLDTGTETIPVVPLGRPPGYLPCAAPTVTVARQWPVSSRGRVAHRRALRTIRRKRQSGRHSRHLVGV